MNMKPMDDLPKLSAPAHRALAAAGVTKLKHLTRHTEAEVAKWHGIGPSSLKPLRAAMTGVGLSYKGEDRQVTQPVHPLVLQLRFTRSEFLRSVRGVSEDDARQRVMPMNSLSWNVGHLAWQEQRYFLSFAQGQTPLPEINEAFAFGCPASTPALKDMLKAWRTITRAADPWLDLVSSDTLESHVMQNGKPVRQFGALLQRLIYHYWYHTGENMAIRQMLGHQRLGVFVGNIDDEAPYQREDSGT